jgi:hypothetical protein
VNAEYVFRVRVAPRTPEGVRLEPPTVETTLFRRAPPPGEEGWLFFRDELWRGELSNPEHFRRETADALGVPVSTVEFAELRTDEAYWSALRSAVADDPGFEGDPERTLTNYLGSSVRVTD